MNSVWTKVLGIGQAAATAAFAWYMTAKAGGAIDFSNVGTYLGAAIAVLMAVKAWFTQQTPPADKVIVTVAKPVAPEAPKV